jgi:hypothetical protein
MPATSSRCPPGRSRAATDAARWVGWTGGTRGTRIGHMGRVGPVGHVGRIGHVGRVGLVGYKDGTGTPAGTTRPERAWPRGPPGQNELARVAEKARTAMAAWPTRPNGDASGGHKATRGVRGCRKAGLFWPWGTLGQMSRRGMPSGDRIILAVGPSRPDGAPTEPRQRVAASHARPREPREATGARQATGGTGATRGTGARQATRGHGGHARHGARGPRELGEPRSWQWGSRPGKWLVTLADRGRRPPGGGEWGRG